MKKDREKFLCAIYILIRNDKNEVLLQRRQGTKLWPGFLALPAGHVDEGENVYEAFVREAKEELGIEVSKNDKGNSFVKFCLICTRDGINSYSDYINCIAFGEIANAICRKGEKDTAYHIEGNIRTNSYEKNGKKNYSTNVVVESFRLLDA